MRLRKINYFLLVVVGLIFVNCANIGFLPSSSTLRYNPTLNIEIFWEKPDTTIKYSAIGLVIAESDDFTESDLMDKLKNKAMEEGADAIIMYPTKQTLQVHSNILLWICNVALYSTVSHRLEGLAIKFKSSLSSPLKSDSTGVQKTDSIKVW